MADPLSVHTVAGEVLANVGSALAIVPGLEWAKRQTAPWLAWINVHTAPYISIFVAAAAAAGIHGTFDSNAGVLTITGLTLTGIAVALFEIGKQWLMQHWTHKAYQTFDTLKSLAVALDKLASVPTASVPTATSSTGTGDGGRP